MSPDEKTKVSSFKFNSLGHLIIWFVWRTSKHGQELCGVFTQPDYAQSWKYALEEQDERRGIESHVEVEERETDHAYAQSMMSGEVFEEIQRQKRLSD